MPIKTKIDDILIEMISPKLKTIEEKFSRGEGLSNEDVNTLLLKLQFNHINHLDAKLNEVTQDVASLKTEFAELKAEFANLKADFAHLQTNIQKTINRNMQWSIGIIGFIVVIFKLIDTIMGK